MVSTPTSKGNIPWGIEVGEATGVLGYHTGRCGINMGCWGIYPL